MSELNSVLDQASAQLAEGGSNPALEKTLITLAGRIKADSTNANVKKRQAALSVTLRELANRLR